MAEKDELIEPFIELHGLLQQDLGICKTPHLIRYVSLIM